MKLYALAFLLCWLCVRRAQTAYLWHRRSAMVVLCIVLVQAQLSEVLGPGGQDLAMYATRCNHSAHRAMMMSYANRSCQFENGPAIDVPGWLIGRGLLPGAFQTSLPAHTGFRRIPQRTPT